MFTRTSKFSSHGFQPSRRVLRVLELCQRVDDMLMFYTIAAAVLFSMAVIPAYAAIQSVPGAIPSDTVSSGAAPDGTVGNICSGQSWGSETVECLLAINAAGGRKTRDIRVVTARQPGYAQPSAL